MATLDFSTPVYTLQPNTLRDSFSNTVEGFFDWSGKRASIIDPKQLTVRITTVKSSFLTTALKIVLWATLLIPAIMFTIKAFLRYGTTYRIAQEPPSPPLPHALESVINATPSFASYQIGQMTPYAGATLTQMSLRPANLFFKALFGSHVETMPGSLQNFSLNLPHDQIKNLITSSDPNFAVSFSAAGTAGSIHKRGAPVQKVGDLKEIYGDKTYRISYGELLSTLMSQKIYTAPSLPKAFYQSLKDAMLKDGLHGPDLLNYKVKDLPTPDCKAFIQSLPGRLMELGFKSALHSENILNLHCYQLGALVVKSEDYRIFIDGNGKILERNPGDNDAIRLINACGVRNFHQTSPEINKEIMTETFKTAFTAAEDGFVVFPAVGMGVWRGDPNVYWRAFLDAAIVKADSCEKIFINPGHQTTSRGPYSGCNGNELAEILDEYKVQYQENPRALANLNKIVNLFDKKTDLVQLSYGLKKAFPDKTVSLFNASDPDVTLGYHVGEYVNNLDHPSTTEENYTAMGTNGLCFETITGVHQDPARVIQVL